MDPILNLMLHISFEHIFIIITNPGNYVAFFLSTSQTSPSVITQKIPFLVSPTNLLQHLILPTFNKLSTSSFTGSIFYIDSPISITLCLVCRKVHHIMHFIARSFEVNRVPQYNHSLFPQNIKLV